MSPALNGIGSMTAVTGPLPAPLGGSRSGAILLESRVPSFGRHATLSYASDRFIGPSLGLNRLEGELSGASRRSRVFIGATLTGQKAAEPGAGARDIPIFVSAGIDTLVAVPESPGVPGSDISLVPVFNYAAARGDKDEQKSIRDGIVQVMMLLAPFLRDAERVHLNNLTKAYLD